MKFKCLVSGTIVEFTHPVDIESTLAHPQYEVVLEEPVEVKKEVKSKTKSE
jgi:hypothetical protein